MIQDSELVELRTYRALEQSIAVRECPNIGSLVAATGNENKPVYGWFRFKESYDADLLPTLLSRYPPEAKMLRILDPYCGVGTTLLSAQKLAQAGASAVGIEHNPFIRFVAQAKLMWHQVDPERLVRIGERVLTAPLSAMSAIPALSSIKSGRCISAHIARRLLGIRDAILTDGDSPEHQLLLLGLASAIEGLSRTRKDGRALRLMCRPRQIVSSALQSRWARMADDLRKMRNCRHLVNATVVYAGDGRNPVGAGVGKGSVDVIATSPPYPNNIDYSEVYKLELWLLGFVGSSEDFLRLRKGTFRSHPTSQLNDIDSGAEQALLRGSAAKSFEQLLGKLQASEESWRRRLIIGYFTDMKNALMQYFDILCEGGRTYITVGNSLHGGNHAPYLIATDLLLASLAREIGFRVNEVAVARSLRRRLSGNHFLRESVVVLSK